MKRLFLTSEEKADLELRHQYCENRKEGDRIKAILLRSEGWTVPQIRDEMEKSRSVNGSSIKSLGLYKGALESILGSY